MLTPKRSMVCLAVLAALAGGLCLAAFAPQSVSASTLPPRATFSPTSTAAPIASPVARANSPITVGTIALTVSNPPPAAWVGVQWQDDWGRWHDVESWPGPLSDGEAIRWVEPQHFGLGPFRWLVYEEQAGPVWATSAAFYFPRRAGEWVWTTIAAADPTPTPAASASPTSFKKPALKATPKP